MTTVDRPTTLLEALQGGAGLEYLSDLHERQFRQRVRLCVAKLSPERFDPSEWRCATAYILQTDVAADGATDLKALLLRRLDG